jgi:hypothetical protein
MSLGLSSPAKAGDPVIPALGIAKYRIAAAYWMPSLLRSLARFRGP